MARRSCHGSHGEDAYATTGEEGVILIFLSALSALSAVGRLPPRRRHYDGDIFHVDCDGQALYVPKVSAGED